MEITYIGLGCLRLRGREADVLIDPVDDLPRGVKVPRLDPDIVVRTRGRTDPALLRPAEGQPQTVSGPGEYELAGVRITGHDLGGGRTAMCVIVDEVRVVALGAIDRQLSEDAVEALGHVDVLAVPVGGGGALGASEAVTLVNVVEPFIVVPTRYSVLGLWPELEGVERFAKEMGLTEGLTPQAKLVLTGSSGSVEQTRVILLEPRAQL